MSDTISLSPSRLGTARETLQQRQAGLIKTIRDRSPNRFSDENANQDDSWEGKWLKQDQERGRQLDWLEKALAGDNLTQFANEQATANEADDVYQAETAHRRQSGLDAAQAARSGQAGSSVEAEQQSDLGARLANAKAQAKLQADELRAAGIKGVDAMEDQLVEQIMGKNAGYEAAQQAALSGQRVDLQGAEIQGDLDQKYRDILAKTLGSIINTGGNAVNAGFDNADRRNQKSQDDWERWNNSGRQGDAPKITDNTWWGF